MAAAGRRLWRHDDVEQDDDDGDDDVIGRWAEVEGSDELWCCLILCSDERLIGMVRGFETLMVIRLVGRIWLNMTLDGTRGLPGSALAEMSIMLGKGSSSAHKNNNFNFCVMWLEIISILFFTNIKAKLGVTVVNYSQIYQMQPY